MQEQKIYQIRVKDQLVPVEEKVYYAYYRAKRYEKNLEEKDARNRKVLFSIPPDTPAHVYPSCPSCRR